MKVVLMNSKPFVQLSCVFVGVLVLWIMIMFVKCLVVGCGCCVVG